MAIDLTPQLNIAQIAFALSVIALILVLFATGKLDFKDPKKR